MKTKSLKNGDYEGTGLMLLGGVLGALGSRALITLAHDPNSTNALIKGYLPAKRIAIAGSSFVGSSIIDGKDSLSTVVKGAGIGMALMQVIDLVKEVSVTKVADTGTKTNRIMRGALGLNCPGEVAVASWGGMGKTRARAKHGLKVFVPETATAQFRGMGMVVNAY